MTATAAAASGLRVGRGADRAFDCDGWSLDDVDARELEALSSSSELSAADERCLSDTDDSNSQASVEEEQLQDGKAGGGGGDGDGGGGGGGGAGVNSAVFGVSGSRGDTLEAGLGLGLAIADSEHPVGKRTRVDCLDEDEASKTPAATAFLASLEAAAALPHAIGSCSPDSPEARAARLFRASMIAALRSPSFAFSGCYRPAPRAADLSRWDALLVDTPPDLSASPCPARARAVLSGLAIALNDERAASADQCAVEDSSQVRVVYIPLPSPLPRLSFFHQERCSCVPSDCCGLVCRNLLSSDRVTGLLLSYLGFPALSLQHLWCAKSSPQQLAAAAAAADPAVHFINPLPAVCSEWRRAFLNHYNAHWGRVVRPRFQALTNVRV